MVKERSRVGNGLKMEILSESRQELDMEWDSGSAPEEFYLH
jgi:hypothetical protein